MHWEGTTSTFITTAGIFKRAGVWQSMTQYSMLTIRNSNNCIRYYLCTKNLDPLYVFNYLYTSVPMQSKMTANLLHYKVSVILLSAAV